VAARASRVCRRSGLTWKVRIMNDRAAIDRQAGLRRSASETWRTSPRHRGDDHGWLAGFRRLELDVAVAGAVVVGRSESLHRLEAVVLARDPFASSKKK
jgi:hypothetical protein